MNHCPLCLGTDTRHFATVGDIHYRRCDSCLFTWMLPEHWPTLEEEKAQYDLHDNHVDSQPYRTFLSRLTDPLKQHLQPGMKGLDFGCGPGPALAAMMNEAGFPTQVYDPIYYPDTGPLNHRYDFITCTEVAEHLHEPRPTFEQLDTLLADNGILAIMTRWLTEDDAFADWRYRRDPTHVCFYRTETLEWIARHFGWTLTLPTLNVSLFFRKT